MERQTLRRRHGAVYHVSEAISERRNVTEGSGKLIGLFLYTEGPNLYLLFLGYFRVVRTLDPGPYLSMTLILVQVARSDAYRPRLASYMAVFLGKFCKPNFYRLYSQVSSTPLPSDKLFNPKQTIRSIAVSWIHFKAFGNNIDYRESAAAAECRPYSGS